MCPFVRAPDIGTAWRDAFAETFSLSGDHKHLTLEVTDPVGSGEIPDSTDLRDWESKLNLGEPYTRYCTFDLQKEADHAEGSMGRDWIQSRIYEMYDGIYASRMRDMGMDQVELVTDRLKQGNHGSCTNALVIQVFDP